MGRFILVVSLALVLVCLFAFLRHHARRKALAQTPKSTNTDRPEPTPQPQAPLAFRALLPDRGPVHSFETIRLLYPKEWSQLEAQLLAIAPDDPHPADQERAILADFLRPRATCLSRAPDSTLIDLLHAELALAKVLRADNISACADFLKNGSHRGLHYSVAAASALDLVTSAMVVAAHAGAHTPYLRPADISPDSRHLFSIMDARGTREGITTGHGLYELSPTETCRSGILLLEVLTTLPEDQAARLFASMRTVPA